MKIQKYQKLAIVLLVFIHICGAFGLLSDYLRPKILGLTPLFLIINFTVALVFYKPHTFRLYASLIGIGIAGFIVEYAGVYTGWIFGNYHYGKTLGPGFREIPFIIGFNWLALVFYSQQLLPARIKNGVLRSAIAATYLTLFDLLLEPSAMRYDFWQWENHEVPIQNYAAWWAVSFAFSMVMHGLGNKIKPGMGRWILLIQGLFFIGLYAANRYLVF